MNTVLHRFFVCALSAIMAIIFPVVSHAQNWSNLATVSMTNATTPKLTNRYMCYTDGRDIRCDSSSIYITTGGLVGINTTNPTTQMEINGTVSATTFVGNGSGITNLSSNRITNSTISVTVNSDGYISLSTAGTDWGYLSSGNSYIPTLVAGRVSSTSISGSIIHGSPLYINTVAGASTAIGPGAGSGYSLDVGASSTGYVSRFINTDTSTGTDGIIIQTGPVTNPTTASNYILFRDGDGTDIGYVRGDGAGSLQFSGTSSDKRIKKNITNTRYGLADLMKVQVHDYLIKSHPETGIETGFIAQELEGIFPIAVQKPMNDQDIYRIEYGRITPLIIKAVQDLKTIQDKELGNLRLQIQNMGNEIENLRREINRLQSVKG